VNAKKFDSNDTYDVIVIGGGIIGCATAYYLKSCDERLDVAVVERDPTYEKASTPLSDGNIRIQFNIRENILISLYGLEVLNGFADEMAVDGERPDVGFLRQGNLFLINEEGRSEAMEGLLLQNILGCRVEWLTGENIGNRYPMIYPEWFVGGTLGIDDGTLDPWTVLTALKKKAASLDTTFVHADVAEILKTERAVTGIALTSGSRQYAKYIVNCAGAWASLVARTVGINLPIHPVRRQVFVIETETGWAQTLPAFFFPSGLYCIHKTDRHFVCGKSLPDDPVGYDLTWCRQTFTDIIWPELVECIPSFDRLKLTGGWSGLYAVNTFDGNALLGEWPDLNGFFLANGFSGHGFQQCFAVGRYLAELILDRPPTIDLSVFSPSRLLENKPIFENRSRII